MGNNSTVKAANVVIIIMTCTICAVIMSVIGTIIVHPERASEGNAIHIMDLLKYMLGMISGYIGGKHLGKD